ncbi:DUF4124 domain-containing protein [Agrilutibacter niabensis]|uniref:DUF4124 domain-containing protein n=1 Tax=Agrilutibacter niabensis TaxID=380628 RepID=UPI0036DD1BCF
MLTTRLLVGSAILLLALPVLAGKVYQWKDAKGVTHYSDAPPKGQQGVKNRELSDGPASATADAAKPAEAPNCVTARKNLAQLKSEGPVGLDADGDGKLDKEMTPDERSQQVRQTEMMLKTYCDKPAAGP